MSTLLLEIGVEELPASFVRNALAAMPELARKLFESERLSHGAIRALGTPRRLALLVEDLAERQTDLSEQVLGPPKAAAFDESGKPKKAAEGFAKKLGVPVEALALVATDKGEYVAAQRDEKGKPAAEVLAAGIARLITQIPFAKSMRWGTSELAFGRPIHWIVALHGERVVDVEIAGARAGRSTRGHRFLAPASFELARAEGYVEALRAAHVLVDPDERTARMNDALAAAATQAGGVLVEDAFLVGENASLVEEPHVIAGSFDAAYLSLPDSVIVEVMKGHQRYFALRDRQGKLLPRYLAVVNTALAPDVVVRGNDRVLRARLADARFFVDEDRKHTLASRLDTLAGVDFQAKLGSVRERVERMRGVALGLWGDGDAGAAVREAAYLCKNDLVTHIVGELPELQGAMGRYYALEQGVPAEVADAIRDHYAPRGAADAVPSSITSARLAVADRADVLVGCFGLGQVPSGSADPYGLRRAALGIVRIALEGPLDVELDRLLHVAWQEYADQGKPLAGKDEVVRALDEFFRGRLRVYLAERHPTDLALACIGAWQGGSIRDLAARVAALESFRAMPEYESLTVAFKRAYNIAKDAPPLDADPTLFAEPEERALAERFATVRPRIEQAVAERDYERALSIVARDLREPIDRFFEKVFVMVEDAAVRDNRLRLLGAIARTLTSIAHFHLLGA